MDIERSNQSHWIPLADLMTGLMMVFMLLTAAFMLRVEQTTTLVVKEYEETKNNLQQALQKEFSTDLKQWNAEILGDMTIRFNDPSVLFETGMADVRPEFKDLLKEFFPRYINLITSERFRNAVKEVRIEGHTSLSWNNLTDPKTAYLLNMKLSQERTRNSLEYILSLADIEPQQQWLIQHVTANGLSSSKPIIPNALSSSDQLANQRVEFRIVTNASERMDQIALKLKNQ